MIFKKEANESNEEFELRQRTFSLEQMLLQTDKETLIEFFHGFFSDDKQMGDFLGIVFRSIAEKRGPAGLDEIISICEVSKKKLFGDIIEGSERWKEYENIY